MGELVLYPEASIIAHKRKGFGVGLGRLSNHLDSEHPQTTEVTYGSGSAGHSRSEVNSRWPHSVSGSYPNQKQQRQRSVHLWHVQQGVMFCLTGMQRLIHNKVSKYHHYPVYPKISEDTIKLIADIASRRICATLPNTD